MLRTKVVIASEGQFTPTPILRRAQPKQRHKLQREKVKERKIRIIKICSNVRKVPISELKTVRNGE
jgi:hypothetical protein